MIFVKSALLWIKSVQSATIPKYRIHSNFRNLKWF